MSFKSHRQPLCRACGKPIAKRTSTVWIPADQRAAITCIADAQKLTNLKVVSIARTGSDIEKKVARMARRRGEKAILSPIRKYSTWDGETYEDEFFCKGTCAQSYARMMAAAGDAGRHNIRSAAYADSLREQAGMKPR